MLLRCSGVWRVAALFINFLEAQDGRKEHTYAEEVTKLTQKFKLWVLSNPGEESGDKKVFI